jgi:hypothetical protein
MSPKAMRAAAEVPNAAKILQADYYGWFMRIERGIYRLTEAGRHGLAEFGHALPPAAPVAAAAD